MKTILPVIILLLVSLNSYGQISYEKGYFIDNVNKKTECLIKNSEWKNNPKKFTYKLELVGQPVTRDIETVKEFGVYGSSKYIRTYVKIDRSSDGYTTLTTRKDPEWSEEKLFLKVLIEGKASLYYYENANIKRFFYSVSDTSVTQLIYKSYLLNNGVAENNKFHQQLWSYVRCANATVNSVEKLSYTAEDLERYFLDYNRCMGDPIVENKNKLKKDFFNLKIAPGFNLTSVSLHNVDPSNGYLQDLSFKQKLNLRLGLEFEFILPYNKNKWGILFEPTFHSSYMDQTTYYSQQAGILFKNVQFPVGIRYYFFLHKGSKIFVNGFYITSFSLRFDSRININKYYTVLTETRDTWAFGAGAERNRFSCELRYYGRQGILNYNTIPTDWFSDYRKLSFIIGYKLVHSRK